MRRNSMPRYVLEVKTWDEWAVEREFHSLKLAKGVAEEGFSQHEWRIMYRGRAIVQYSPVVAMAEDLTRLREHRLMMEEHFRGQEERENRRRREARMNSMTRVRKRLEKVLALDWRKDGF